VSGRHRQISEKTCGVCDVHDLLRPPPVRVILHGGHTRASMIWLMTCLADQFDNVGRWLWFRTATIFLLPGSCHRHIFGRNWMSYLIDHPTQRRASTPSASPKFHSHPNRTQRTYERYRATGESRVAYFSRWVTPKHFDGRMRIHKAVGTNTPTKTTRDGYWC
jgi:hypothetical protein